MAATNRNFATVIPIPTADAPVVGALNASDAGRYLSLSLPTLRRLVAAGLLRPNRYTRHLLFPIGELERFLNEGIVYVENVLLLQKSVSSTMR